jgi:hypothetical protein
VSGASIQRVHANGFYLRHGFVLEGEEGVDLHYRWRVASEDAC